LTEDLKQQQSIATNELAANIKEDKERGEDRENY
jgi:hypothetical protein